MSDGAPEPLAEQDKPPKTARKPATCCYAFITHCDEDGLGSENLRACYRCGDAGLYHHFCALDKKVCDIAAELAGSGASLCAKCSGQEASTPNG
eukprot:1612038-Pleurochrysis_carterae.AAC.1